MTFQDSCGGFSAAANFSSAMESSQVKKFRLEDKMKPLKSLKVKKNAKFLPEITSKPTFLTEPMETSKYSFNKTYTKSKVMVSKFRLTSDSKILDSLQSSIQKKNYSSISILPKLKESILSQNGKALEALSTQGKMLQQEYNTLMNKKLSYFLFFS